MVDSNLLTYFIVLEIASFILTYKFYVAAGRKAWEAAIPFYKTYVMMGIIKRKKWHTILFFIPIVSNIMALVMVYELFHVFNYRKLKHTILTIATAGLYLGFIGFTKKLTYVGKDEQNIKKTVSELGASLIFAVVAATIIRTFTFEAYTIPTPSMEKSLMVGDFLFVSKIHYGSRMPITPLTVPLVHNKIPFSSLDSYLEWVQLPYFRFPKLASLKPMDPVVFNYPAEDIRPINMEGKVRPIDKRENYVKRCVAMAGDTLRIESKVISVNGEKVNFPDRAKPQTTYLVEVKQGSNLKMLKDKFDINVNEIQKLNAEGTRLAMPISLAFIDELKQLNWVLSVSQYEFKEPDSRNLVFPNPAHEVMFEWTRDNYGPLYIPAKGATIQLNEENYYTYKRAIEMYDHPTPRVLSRLGNTFSLDGEPISEYTFQQDYYFMMGDNAHMSDDSRFWGFVPEDHIVGKPVFIWMSWDQYGDKLKDKIRTERVFTTVNSDGERKSYLLPFLLVVIVFYIGNHFYKKRKEKKASA
jgi:signal peptidase I